MKRRDFVKAGATVAGSQLVDARRLRAQTAAGSVERPTRTGSLFEQWSGGLKISVQQVLFWNGTVYCLSFAATRRFVVSATTPDGVLLWQHPLPPAIYTSLGIQGSSLLVQAFSYGGPTAGALFRLDASGGLQLVASLPPATTTLHPAGDSRFLTLASGTVDLWEVGSSGVNHVASGFRDLSEPAPHIDLLTPTTVAMTRKDGMGMITVRLPSCEMEERPIAVPEVGAALARYATALEGAGNVGHPVVISATGSDTRGGLFGLILPAPASAVPVARFDSAGAGSVLRSIQLPSKAPMPVPLKLLINDADIGVAFADGSVAWYSI